MTVETTKISAVIITLNEDKNIGRCLFSLRGIADDIVVVDSFSTDATREISTKHGARVFDEAWMGFSAQKNFGNSLARYDWILSIDADEELSEELRNSLLKWKQKENPGFVRFNRLNRYCGKWIRHCGWYPDAKIRLFHRNKAMWQGDVHEKLSFTEDQVVEHLMGDLLHHTTESLSHHIATLNRYSDIWARENASKKNKPLWVTILVKALAKFINIYFLKLGFLEGSHGFMIASHSSYGVFLRYSKLRFLKMPNG